MTDGGQGLCGPCHTPHNALGPNLWSSVPSGTYTGVKDLCYTCHDGSVTTVGSTTILDDAKEQHLAVGPDCSGAGACHNVHNQNPNGSGRFVVETRTNNSYCESCHDDTPFPGATAQTINPDDLTNPILLADNRPGDFYGAFCISCHKGIDPAEGVIGSGGYSANDMHDYTQFVTDGSETSHPTTAAQGDDGYPIGGCDLCHDVHDPANPDYGYILKEDNANSAYCGSCHNGFTSESVGANTHFTGVPVDADMNDGLNPPLPWADQINEDAFPGLDWPTATANNIVCETCHSVHRRGWQSNGGKVFLRYPYSNGNALCRYCHSDN